LIACGIAAFGDIIRQVNINARGGALIAHRIVAAAAVDRVTACTGFDQIILRAAQDGVVARRRDLRCR
jgi:hypothetical protein